MILIDSIVTVFDLNENEICDYIPTFQEYLVNARSKSDESEFDKEWNDDNITDVFKSKEGDKSKSWIGFLYMLFLEKNLE